MNTIVQRLGKYELQQPLGQGGMAEVWKAFDTQLQRYVAIKLLHPNLQDDPNFISRFTHEARMIAALRHPNIVQIYDFHVAESAEVDDSKSDTIAYMVMEYINGGTLATYIHDTSHQRQFPTAAEIVRLFTSISLAIDYAHQQGMIHRDIKPSNILLDQSCTTFHPLGEPLLADFGLAKLVGSASQTATAAVFGTPLYISPEQILNHPVSKQADLYALGIVLYELFTGLPPFRGDNVTSIMLQRLTSMPVAPHLVNPALPPALSQVLLQSLASNPLDRFPSAAAMLTAIAAAFDIPAPQELQAASSSTNTGYLLKPAGEAVSSPHATIAVPQTSQDTSVTSQQTKVLQQISSDLTRTPASAMPPATTSSPRLAATIAMPAPPLQTTSKKRRLPRMALLCILVCALLLSGLSIYSLHSGHHTTAAVGSSSNVGQAFFLSSGQGNQTMGKGSNDEFQLDLHNIPNPPSGMSYYAWLLPDKNQTEAAPILLGKVAANHGIVHFFYPGDSSHTDLLAIVSRFLITQEDTNLTPVVPSPDLKAWRYYAEIPQVIASGQTYSLLDHLRHLLADDPELIAYHLPGGLDFWASRNTHKVLAFATNARSAWNAQNLDSTRQQLAGALDYLDGTQLVAADVPATTPIVANPTYSRIGLLELMPGRQDPPGYLNHIELHLNGVLAAPGATQNQRNLATQIDTGLNNVNTWLEQARHDAAQLEAMNAAQLALPSSLTLLNALVSQANYAYNGRADASTGKLQQGISQIVVDAQHLATFEIAPYK